MDIPDYQLLSNKNPTISAPPLGGLFMNACYYEDNARLHGKRHQPRLAIESKLNLEGNTNKTESFMGDNTAKLEGNGVLCFHNTFA